ncbi:hypothetical protein GCM10022197_16290 [Microlunatus spumicola]|uniref:Uncharacterized protein n=1 Tax=Microlunatus spumicola TaxID=81499 RepID=A0ABP6X4M9_9ACTN
MVDDTVLNRWPTAGRSVGTASADLPEPSVATRVRAFEVRVELVAGASLEDLRTSLRDELGPDVSGSLQDLDPRLATVGPGRSTVLLTVPGQDVWTCALTAMVVLRQLGHEPHALHVEQRHDVVPGLNAA